MKSRPKRWAKAIAEAQGILEKISDLAEELNGAVDNVHSIQEEYEEWYANLPEGLEGSTTADKLQAVIDLELDFDI
jgi:DNA repair exonuclease SbcCD ATPase subunit